MGFFSSIKKNLNHGGVKLQLDSPGSASVSDESIKTSVTIIASEPQTIKQVRVRLEAQRTVQRDDNVQSTETQIVSQQEVNEQFTLAAGESKTVELVLPLNGVGTALNSLGLTGKAADIAGKLGGALAMVNHQPTTYHVVATADVDGVKLDPSISNGISMNQLGEMGTTKTIHL